MDEARAVRSYEDLVVLQRADRVSLEDHRRSLVFPKIEQRALGDQVRRASKSICANIAEGFGKQRQSAAEFKRFLMMAMGSAIASISDISMRRCGVFGETNIRRSPRCCRVSVLSRVGAAAVALIPDP